ADARALRYAEPVLSVHNGEPERAELHLFLEQRVRADRHGRLPRCNDGKRRIALPSCLAAREPGDLETERTEPLAELAKVLLGEDLGGRHDRGLQAVFDRAQSGEHGNNGIAAAAVALKQRMHGSRLLQLAPDLGTCALMIR